MENTLKFNNNSNKGMVRTVFSNTHEASTTGEKKFYGVITVKDTSFLTTYSTKFRGQAVEIFNKEAAKIGGQVTAFGAF